MSSDETTMIGFDGTHITWRGRIVFASSGETQYRLKKLAPLFKEAEEAWGAPYYAEARDWLQRCMRALEQSKSVPPIPSNRTSYGRVAAASARKDARAARIRLSKRRR